MTADDAPPNEQFPPNDPEHEPVALAVQPMTISFRDVNGGSIDFKMKPTTKLSKAMTAFAGRMGHDQKQLRFLFDGTRVTDEDTPESVC